MTNQPTPCPGCEARELLSEVALYCTPRETASLGASVTATNTGTRTAEVPLGWKERRDAWLAAHPAPAPYPWAEGVDLTGGRVIMRCAADLIGTVIQTELDHDGERIAWVHWDSWTDPKRKGVYDLGTISPAPFTPEVGQRVRVVSDAESTRVSQRYMGRDGCICDADKDISSGSVVVQFDDVTQFVNPHNLMLLAPAAEAAPDAPRKWRRFTEQEQWEMPVGTRLKIKGGPVVEERGKCAWFNVDLNTGPCTLWTYKEVATLKARVVQE